MPKEIKCWLCGKKLPEDKEEDYLCHGCGKHICEECDQNYDMPFGSHDPMLHKEDPEDW